jgi:hypothetical protein
MSESSTIRGYELNTGYLNTPLRKWIFYTIINLFLYVGGVNPVIFGMADGRLPSFRRWWITPDEAVPWYIFLTLWGFVPIVIYASGSGVEYFNRTIGCAESPGGNVHQLYPVGSKRDDFFQFLYQVAITLQPFVVVGYWGLVFPDQGTTSFNSVIRHGIAAIAIYAELLLGERPWKNELMKYVLLVPITWVVIQFYWVVCMKEEQAYEVLAMDDLKSLILTIFALGFFIASFKLGGRVTRYRDERVGRFPDDLERKTTGDYDEDRANVV